MIFKLFLFFFISKGWFYVSKKQNNNIYPVNYELDGSHSLFLLNNYYAKKF